MGETLRDAKTEVPDLLNRQWEHHFEGNYSISVVGDLHLHASTPKSRIDNFPDTCIEKLGILRRQMRELDSKILICPGDIFHIPRERTDFEFRVIEAFQKFKVDGITVYCLSGNHDIANDRIDNITKTSLGILFLTGIVRPFTQVEIKTDGEESDVVITGTNFPLDIVPARQGSEYQINVSHRFFEEAGDSNYISVEDAKKYGYNMYICGHDHIPYDLKKISTDYGVLSVVRPGSFTRGTSHCYNTDRLVYMDQIKVGKKIEVERHTLAVKDPKEIFPASVTDKVEDSSLKDVTRQLADLVTQMYSLETSNNSVYSILDESPIDPEIKARIIMYLENFGIYRRNNIVN